MKHLFGTFIVTDDGKDVLFHLYIYFYLKYNAVSFSLLRSNFLVYPFILMTLFLPLNLFSSVLRNRRGNPTILLWIVLFNFIDVFLVTHGH